MLPLCTCRVGVWASCWRLPPLTLRGVELFCVCLCVGFTLPTVRCPVTCGPLTADGAMYEWGTLWERAIVSPQRIHLPSPSPSDQKRVVQIACGRKHALALDGELAHVSQRACPEFRMLVVQKRAWCTRGGMVLWVGWATAPRTRSSNPS